MGNYSLMGSLNGSYNGAPPPETSVSIRISYNSNVRFVDIVPSMSLDQVKEAVVDYFGLAGSLDDDDGGAFASMEDVAGVVGRMHLVDKYNARIGDGRSAIAAATGCFITAVLTAALPESADDVIDATTQGTVVDQWARQVERNPALRKLFLQVGSADTQQAEHALSFVQSVNAKILEHDDE